MQPYMTQDHFPVDWAGLTMLKQFLGNHYCWLHKKGCLVASPPKVSRKGKECTQLENQNRSGLGNSDSIDDLKAGECSVGSSGLCVVN